LQSIKSSAFSRKLFEILLEGCNEELTILNKKGEIQSQNALFNYQDFIKYYGRIWKLYKSLNKFKPVSDYLSRKVCPPETYQSDKTYSRFISSHYFEDIFQVVEKEKCISLLADAGMGKTTELKQIAYHYSKLNSPFYPIFVSLNKYIGAKYIFEYFPSYWDLIPEN